MLPHIGRVDDDLLALLVGGVEGNVARLQSEAMRSLS